MDVNLRPLEFEEVGDGHCCELCNPLHLAEYETRCVPVRAPGGNRAYFCVPCVRGMARAARGIPGTNAADLQRWRDLETLGELGRHVLQKERRAARARAGLARRRRAKFAPKG